MLVLATVPSIPSCKLTSVKVTEQELVVGQVGWLLTSLPFSEHPLGNSTFEHQDTEAAYSDVRPN